MGWIVIIVILVVAFLVYCIYDTKHLKTTDYILEQEHVPKAFHNMRFVCLTDLHQNVYGQENENLLRLIHDCKPDIILIAGDMITVSELKHSGRVTALLLKLAQSYPVYYAPGNHELKWSELKKIQYQCFIKDLTDNGIVYLSNQTIQIRKDKDTMKIIGLNLPIQYFNKGMKPTPLSVDTLKSYIGTKDNDYTILLAHAPDYFDTYAKWGADVVLSGHNHGGMMRLGKIGGVISPRYQLFPKYDAGIYHEQDTVMFLSRGLGSHTIPIRIFNRPELICVQIRQKLNPML